MELKELIGEEIYTTIADKVDNYQVIIAAKDEKYVKDDGTFITKERMNEVVTQRLGEVTEQKRILTESKEALETTLEQMKTDNKGNEELTTQIESMKEEIAKKDKEIIYTAKKSALLNDLTKVVKYPELLLSKFNIDELEKDGESIKGFDDLIKPIKESYPDQFGVKAPPEGDGGPTAPAGEFNLTPQEKKAAKDRGLSEEDYHAILEKNKEIKVENKTMNW